MTIYTVRFTPSDRDKLTCQYPLQLSPKDITVTRESIRLGCIKLDAIDSCRLKPKHKGYGDTFFDNWELLRNKIPDSRSS